jgi:hypothetical protein
MSNVSGAVAQKRPRAIHAANANQAAVSLDKQQFLNLCSQANTRVDLAERRFSAWLSSLAIAYGRAWQSHKDFLARLDKTAAQRPLAIEVLLDAGLAFFPGAAGGAIADVMKRLNQGTPMIDGMKDLAKWGLRSNALVGVMRAAPTASMAERFRAFPTDPLQWQNEVNLRVQSELAQVTAIIEDWQNKTNTGDPNFAPDFNPLEKVDAALVLRPRDRAPAGLLDKAMPKIAGAVRDVGAILFKPRPEDAVMLEAASGLGVLAGATRSRRLVDLRPVNQPAIQAAFERGFLVAWFSENGYAVLRRVHQNFYGHEVGDKLIAYGEQIGLRSARDMVTSCRRRISEEIRARIENSPAFRTR